MFNKSSDSTRKSFIEYLDNLGVSPKTHKNYRSDLSHFTAWLILKVRSFGSYIETLTEAIPFLDKSIGAEYKFFLVENKIPVKTINRRLSTLRHLAKHLTQSQVLDLDFMDGIENLSEGKNYKFISPKIIEDFRAQLESEKVSKNTVKNYLSDVRQFLDWLETNNQSLISNR